MRNNVIVASAGAALAISRKPCFSQNYYNDAKTLDNFVDELDDDLTSD